MKKLLSICLVAAMLLSTVAFSAFAGDSIAYPKCAVTVLTGEDLYLDNYDMTLDYGLNFKALETIEEMEAGPYSKWIVDFEVSFDKPVTAILAGQYDSFSKNWVALNEECADYSNDKFTFTEKGLEFAANDPVPLMQTAYDILDEYTDSCPVIDYEQIVRDVQSFNCGIKITCEEDVEATVQLKMYEATVIPAPNPADNVYETTGFSVVIAEKKYNHKGAVEIDTTVSEPEIVEAINNATINEFTSEETKEEIVEIIKTLPAEEAANISAEVMANLVEDVASEPVAKIPGTNNGIEISCEQTVENELVFDVSATNTAGEEVKELEAPVLVKVAIADLGLAADQKITKVIHEHEGETYEPSFFVKDGYIYITMSRFSTLTFLASTAPVTGSAILGFAPKAGAKEGTAEFDLLLTGDTSNTVRGLLSGEFVVTLPAVEATYNLIPNNATSIYYTDNANGTRTYRFNLEGVNPEDAWTNKDANIVNNSIKIATLVITGYGVAGSVEIANIIDLEKYAPGTGTDTAPIAYNIGDAADFDIAIPTRNLTINVDTSKYRVQNQVADYQAMNILIEGEDIAPISYDLGDEAVNGIYTGVVALPVNGIYTVKLTAEGYRDAYYEIEMTCDKTLNFWINHEFAEVPMEVYVDANGNTVNAGLKKSNFLAGDIIEDSIINEYDLSAVVSYFGESAPVTVANPFIAAYDINRDGKVDSKDVAIVLAGFGF